MAYTTIDDPSAHFQVKIFTGNATDDTAYTNDGNSDLQPDMLWVKNRDASVDHVVFDSTRGVTKNVRPNTTAVESTNSNYLKSIQSDGFTMGTSNRVNGNTNKMVAWQWKANGGTTSSNTDGDITSTVQANTTAGFSIVSYTGNGTDEDTVGHGLSGNWDVAILKNRGETDYWTVSQTGTNQVILLHDTTTQSNHSTAYMTRASGVMGLVGAGDLGMVNGSSETYIAYVFKNIQGYSRFGSYTGNGNADGPFVYTGFKPAWLMIKRTDNAEGWHILDNKRDTLNEMNTRLQAEAAGTDDTSEDGLDMLSNGFKIRTSWAGHNASSGAYFFMAFAEKPFVSSEGTPTTAR